MTSHPTRTRPSRHAVAAGFAALSIALVGAACSDDDGSDDDLDNPVDGVDDQVDDGADRVEREIDEEVTG